MEITTLCAHLEEVFELEELMALSENLLGFAPDTVGGTAKISSFARALAEHCVANEAVEALRDAVVAKKPLDSARFVGLSSETLGKSELRAGDRFGPFTIFQVLGTGPTGAVYRVQFEDRDLRLKVLRRSCAGVPRGLQRFLTYARLCRDLTGPGLPKGLSVGNIDGAHYLVQEYFAGEPLAELVRQQGAMHLNDAAGIIRHLLEALQSYHSAGLAHGNLKASNILVKRLGHGQVELELLDPGADRLEARAPDNGRIEVLRVAAPATAAPEVWGGEPSNPRSDIYAAGMLIYQLLSGASAVEGESPLDLALAHLTEIPEAPSTKAPEGWISSALDDFVMRLLQRTKEQRPSDAEAALDAFEHLMMARSQRPPASAELIDERIEKLLNDPLDAGLALALEAVAEDGVNGLRVAETFMRAFEALSDEPGHLQARINLAFRAGRIFRQAGNAVRAEQVYAALLQLDPGNRVALSAIDDLLRQLGKFDELVEIWLSQTEAAATPLERAEAMAKIGALYEGELKDTSQAWVAYTQAFCFAPEKEDYARAIERLAKADSAAWNDILASCSEAVPNQTTEDSIRLLLAMGRWYADKLTRYDLALQCYQSILANDAANDAAIVGVAHIYRRAQQWPELAQTLARQAATAKTRAQARDLYCEAADIHANKLGDSNAAQALLTEVLEEDPTHKAASEGLLHLYERSQDFARVAELLENQARAARGKERVALYCRVGEVQEDRLVALDAAQRAFQTALEEDPAHLPALRGLDRIYTKQGKYAELLNNLREQERLAATPRQKLLLLGRCASIYEEEFFDPQIAIATYQEMLGIDGKNDAALSALGRLYSSEKRWRDAADVYERHEELSQDPARKISLLLARARLLHQHLEAPDQAIKSYESVLALQADHAEALSALAALRESAGDADEALRAVEALAEGSHDAQLKADSYVKAAELLRARGDLLAAVDRYGMALAAVPDHQAAADGLYATYVSRGDNSAAANVLLNAIELSRLPSRRAKLSAELARLALFELQDLELAENAATQAFEGDHASPLGLLVMSRVLLQQQRNQEAVVCLERLLNVLDQLQPSDAVDAVFSYIDLLSEAGSAEAALAHISTVRRLAPDDPKALQRVAALAFEYGDPSQARNLYTELLDRFEDVLPPKERFLASYRRADATLRTGQVDMAVMLLEDVCDLDPTSPLPLRALAEGYAARQQWERVWEIKSRLLDTLDGDAWVNGQMELGELAADKLGDKSRAVRCFVAALDQRPDDRKLLARLMQLYSEEKDWSHLVEVVIKLAEFQEDAAQRCKYLMTAGMLNARELHDFDAALDCFAEVMALDPTHQKAFDESLSIHRDRANHGAAERLLKTKMKAASTAKDSQTLLTMFDALGELYQEIGRIDDGVDAYEAAQTLDPDNRERLEKLVSLYSSNAAKYFDKARLLHEQQLRADPYRADAYKALRKLYTEAKNADAAWCLCQALYVLNLAGPDEERFFVRMRAEDPAYAQAVLNDDDWGMLAHPDLDPFLTHIFALIEPVVVESRGQSFEQLGHNPYAALDLQRHPLPVAQTLFYAAGVMNQEPPLSFENRNDPGGLQFLPSNPPSLSIGNGVAQSGLSPQALAFIAAQHLCFYRPGFFMRQLVPTGTGLKSWLFAAIKLISPQFPVAPDVEGAVQETVLLLRERLTPAAKDELMRVVSKLLQGAVALDLKRWVSAVDLTADRIGFLLAHDLETAIEVVRASEESNGGQGQRRLKELVLFAISQPYLALRQQLQIDLQT